MILEFLSELTQAGFRIFSVEDAREVAQSIGIKRGSVNYILKSLVAKKAVQPLFRGHYVLKDNLLSGPPLHKFEIATHLTKGGAICCWSSMAYHELTDQVLSTVYVYSPQEKGKTRSLYKYQIEGYEFMLIQTRPENFWGIERVPVGELKVRMTDLERTLIDGLTHTSLCGGFREVLSAFEIAQSRMDVTTLLAYAKNVPVAAQKRLGWILERLDIELTEPFPIPKSSHYDKLDPSGPRRGKYNKKWMIVENF